MVVEAPPITNLVDASAFGSAIIVGAGVYAPFAGPLREIVGDGELAEKDRWDQMVARHGAEPMRSN
ncbi:hypothetical protein MOKP125_50020 [Mycobacterium avium subsp. hominissuis]